MKTHIDIDDSLLGRALAMGHHGTKKEAVHAALAEYVARLALRQLLAQRGRVEWDCDLREWRRDRQA